MKLFTVVCGNSSQGSGYGWVHAICFTPEEARLQAAAIRAADRCDEVTIQEFQLGVRGDTVKEVTFSESEKT